MDSNVRIDDGFQTLITFENIPAVKIFEKTVTPPGMQAGGAIDTTTMRNIAWRTNSPKKLKTLTAISATVAYATVAYAELMAQISLLQQITVTFPDGATLSMWGWLDEFTPGQLEEGNQPTATITIQPSNHDASGAEVAPVYTEGAEDSNS